MKIKNFLLAGLLLASTSVFAKGGDDVGNGGFAYRQSVIILKKATAELEDKIKNSTLADIVNFPERRVILQNTLGYGDLDKLSKKNQYRGGRKLAMNYIVNPPTVIVLKPYFEAFAGKTDTELEDASLEVQKRLLHEAAHIWGYKEEQSEAFAVAFLKNASSEATRPTNDISIGNACICQNGKVENVNAHYTCAKFCSDAPKTDSATLYVNTIMGEQTALNSQLGNLYNWCTVQLYNDQTSPSCVLRAKSGSTTLDLPIKLTPNSNSFSAKVDSLARKVVWDLKVIESKTGSNAETKPFQMKRNSSIPDGSAGALKVEPVNQYTCMSFGGKIDGNGNVIRTSYVKKYYYYPVSESPAPLPPFQTSVAMRICHDEQLYPGFDSELYPRLENVSNHVIFWDKKDIKFSNEDGKLRINRILEERLHDEYGITATLDLFRLMRYPSAANNSTTALGMAMVPFIDTVTGRAFCPASGDFKRNNPLFKLLGDYIPDTEGLYFAESSPKAIQDGTTYKTYYSNQFATEGSLLKFGFYVENGLKVKAKMDDLSQRRIYFYWPTSAATDPLEQGNRTLFTIKSPEEIQGTLPASYPVSNTSDKRIGCIPAGKK